MTPGWYDIIYFYITNSKLHKKVRWLHLWSSQRTRKCVGGTWIIIRPNMVKKWLILVSYLCMTLELIIFIHVWACIHPSTAQVELLNSHFCWLNSLVFFALRQLTAPPLLPYRCYHSFYTYLYLVQYLRWLYQYLSLLCRYYWLRIIITSSRRIRQSSTLKEDQPSLSI